MKALMINNNLNLSIFSHNYIKCVNNHDLNKLYNNIIFMINIL